jgi:hypothetical protein
MCNLYSITTNQAAIIALFRVVNRYVGNLPPMPGVFPDDPAPVVQFWRRPRTATPSGCSTPTGKTRIGGGGSWVGSMTRGLNRKRPPTEAAFNVDQQALCIVASLDRDSDPARSQ